MMTAAVQSAKRKLTLEPKGPDKIPVMEVQGKKKEKKNRRERLFHSNITHTFVISHLWEIAMQIILVLSAQCYFPLRLLPSQYS